jgi:serine/threonine protein kinase
MASPLHLSLLPIEVHASQFKRVLSLSFKKGLHLPDLTPHVHTTLMAAKEKALALPSYILEPQGESDYIATLSSIQTMRLWITYLKEVYQNHIALPQIPSEELQQIETLYALQHEAEEILHRSSPVLIKKRMKASCELQESFDQAIRTMHRKTDHLVKKLARVHGILDPVQAAYAETMLALFFHDFLRLSSQIVSKIQTHQEEWNTLMLQQGRDLLIPPSPECPFCSLLISTQGTYYPLIESVEHLLGKGVDKAVFRGVALPQGAIKAIIKPIAEEPHLEASEKEIRNMGQLTNMWTESELLLHLKHRPGVMQIDMRTVFDIGGKQQLFLAEDYYWDGSLHDYFSYTISTDPSRKKNGRLPPYKIYAAVQQLLIGLRNIHESGIVHHDIKPDNILFDDSEADMKLAFADFHLASYADNLKRLDILRCRAAWASPEYARVSLSEDKEKQYSKVAGTPLDIWSLGVILFSLTTHSYPFWIVEDKQRRHQQQKEAPPPPPDPGEPTHSEEETRAEEVPILQALMELPSEWLPDLVKASPYFPLLEKMLEPDPEKRCSIQQALQLFQHIPPPL